MRGTGKAESTLQSLFWQSKTRPTSGAAGQQGGKDWETPLSTQDPAMGSCIVQWYNLMDLHHLGFSWPFPLGQLLLPRFKSWQMMQNRQLRQHLNSHVMIPKLQPQTQNHPVSHFCFSLCALSFISEIHRNIGLNRASEPSERGEPHTNSGRSCWGYEDPSNAPSFDTNDNGSFSGDTKSWPESTKGVCSEATDLKSKAEYVLGL